MDELNLPVIKANNIPPRWLSMEDYLDFVNLNLKYIIDRKIIREQKRLAAVTTRFLLS
ncbi:MAG: hypothetical protein ABH848_05315 [Candidatus Omnitrophota bacterium]